MREAVSLSVYSLTLCPDCAQTTITSRTYPKSSGATSNCCADHCGVHFVVYSSELYLEKMLEVLDTHKMQPVTNMIREPLKLVFNILICDGITESTELSELVCFTFFK